MGNLSYLGIFLSALSMGFSHCLGMCGGIVLAYAQMQKNPMAHFFYNLGRMSSYVSIGVILALIGHSLEVDEKIGAWFLITLGVFLCIFTLLYTFLPRILSAFEPRVPAFLHAAMAKFLHSPRAISGYFLGILNGFLPCGMVYYFAALALGAGGLLQGVLLMLSFGLGSLVPMFALALGANALMRFKKIFLWLSFLCMLALGGMNIYKGILKLDHQSQAHHGMMHHH